MLNNGPDTRDLLDLTNVSAVHIVQRKEMLEVFTGFEGANAYDVFGPDGNKQIAHAAETTGGFQRVLLGSNRLESIDLLNTSGTKVLSLRERWGFPFSTNHIAGPDDQPRFWIKRRWGWFRRKFSIWGDGSAEMTIKGPLFRPWTFFAYEGDREVAKITKRFSGIGTEMFTDADKFDVEFTGPIVNQEQRLRLLMMAFVIDMKYFEDSNSRNRNAAIGTGIFFGTRR